MNRGFGNILSSEAILGALPTAQNAPQNPPLGLYAEQINGSAFTRARHQNLNTWAYRLLPSVSNYQSFELSNSQISRPVLKHLPPNPMRWSRLSMPSHHTGFIDGIHHVATSGSDKNFYIFQINHMVQDTFYANYDGETLFLPYQGHLKIETEFGELGCSPGEFIVVPRGIIFNLVPQTSLVEGYMLENGGMPFHLPELGLIGANGLAHARHFEYPNASFINKPKTCKFIVKFQQNLWEKYLDHHPFNIVAWHGNYLPYRYDCKKFNSIASVSYDHIDPSINTLLSSESSVPGVSSLDFVIFPEKWHVEEHTFRLPYFHRNIMNELMGLLYGQYDAKADGFLPGGISVHNQMVPHGPDQKGWLKEISRRDTPFKPEPTLAFMFESNEPWQITEFFFKHDSHQKNYADIWKDFPNKNLCE